MLHVVLEVCKVSIDDQIALLSEPGLYASSSESEVQVPVQQTAYQLQTAQCCMCLLRSSGYPVAWWVQASEQVQQQHVAVDRSSTFHTADIVLAFEWLRTAHKCAAVTRLLVPLPVSVHYIACVEYNHR